MYDADPDRSDHQNVVSYWRRARRNAALEQAVGSLPPQRARRDRGMCTDLAAARTACAVVVLHLARISGHLPDGDVFLSGPSGWGQLGSRRWRDLLRQTLVSRVEAALVWRVGADSGRRLAFRVRILFHGFEHRPLPAPLARGGRHADGRAGMGPGVGRSDG